MFIRSDVEQITRPICTGWLGKLTKARESKTRFNEIGSQCAAFYTSDLGFMWEPGFQQKFLKGKMGSRFKITTNKAFEFVAVLGPSLYWKNPQRTVKSRKPQMFERPLFGQMGDPVADQQFQMAMQYQQQRSLEDNARNRLMESYLNYLPIEQTGGGLERHCQRAITEALIKGRSCLWTDKYKKPGSETTLIGSFYDSVDNLFIDPDANSLESAKWIAKRCIHPRWQVERDYNLPPGTLKAGTSFESANMKGMVTADPLAGTRQSQGETADQVVYYKFYSKMGVGDRLSGLEQTMYSGALEVIGDYAYMVCCPGIPYPLNAPPEKLMNATTDEVRQMFAWPIPFWLDDRWPVAELDFYDSLFDEKKPIAWPIAPLSPGLGELVYMNIVISQIANRTWMSSRDLILCAQQAADKLKGWLEGGADQEVITIEMALQNIEKMVSFVQQPPMNMDMWKVLDYVSMQFDKRVGLNELMYGMNPGGTMSRSATDIQIKNEHLGVRPDFLAGQVESWQKKAADMEKLASYWFVKGEDVRPFLGDVGAYFWDQLIVDADPERVVREMEATVEAGSARKRNKATDAANMNAALPMLLPEASKQADMTGDTGPLNQIIQKWADIADFDLTDVSFGPRQQPPPPEVQQMQQAQQQAGLDNVLAETALKHAQADKTAIEAAIESHGAALSTMQAGHDMQMDQATLAENRIIHRMNMIEKMQKPPRNGKPKKDEE